MQQITLMYFSATGGTEKIARRMAASLSGNVKEVDLSDPQNPACALSAEDVAVVAVPAYMGRVPVPAMQALRKISGGGCRAVSIAVYGNRHFDDTLVELNDTLADLGFKVIASGAFVAQHSLVNELAAGRPDDSDLAAIDAFAGRVAEKIAGGKEGMDSTVPGNRPYVSLPPVKSPILVSDGCTKCGICAARCPVGAIPAENPCETDPETCIVCMRCVTVCPAKARSLPKPVQERMAGYLLGNYAARKENETFL